MASKTKKRSAELCDEVVRKYLLLSESEQSLSDLEFYIENELDDQCFS
jgi:hypothetical protein